MLHRKVLAAEVLLMLSDCLTDRCYPEGVLTLCLNNSLGGVKGMPNEPFVLCKVSAVVLALGQSGIRNSGNQVFAPHRRRGKVALKALAPDIGNGSNS